MGVLKQGILGGFSGKVGTVVGSYWKGICTMRAFPASVFNPRTPAQLEQRAKFAAVVEFLKPLTTFLRIGFKSMAIKKTEFNAAMAYNLKNAITGIYPAIAIDYSKAMVSRGSLAGALNPVVASTIAGEVDFSWDDNSLDGNAAATDKVILVVYHPARQQAITVEGGNTRQSGSQTITLPSAFEGEEVQCYIGFQNDKQSVVSNSQYVNSLIVT